MEVICFFMVLDVATRAGRSLTRVYDFITLICLLFLVIRLTTGTACAARGMIGLLAEARGSNGMNE